MEKTIKLKDTNLKLQSSLFTIISYRNVFGSEIFSDIKKMDNKKGKNDDVSQVIDILFRIIYILHKPFTKQSYDEFLMSLDFSVLSDEVELENLSNTIAEMLGGSEVSSNSK